MAARGVIFFLLVLQFSILRISSEGLENDESPVESPPTTIAEFRSDGETILPPSVSDYENSDEDDAEVSVDIDWEWKTTADTLSPGPLAVDISSDNSSKSIEGQVNTTRLPRWNCANQVLIEKLPGETIIVNTTELMKWINVSRVNSSLGACSFVLFYAEFCYFCAEIAAAYNAMGRIFKSLPVLAIDAYNQNGLNARFGVVGVPTILLFFGGKPVLKFNHTRNIKSLSGFLINNTGIEADVEVNVLPEDYDGPLLSYPIEQMDYYLWFSIIFLVSFCCWMFAISRYRTMLWNIMPSVTIKWPFGREKQE